MSPVKESTLRVLVLAAFVAVSLYACEHVFQDVEEKADRFRRTILTEADCCHLTALARRGGVCK